MYMRVTDSRVVIRVEDMVTTICEEVLEVDLNGAVSNNLRLALLVLLFLLLIACYVDPVNVSVENCYPCVYY